MTDPTPPRAPVLREHRELAASAVWPERPGWDDDAGSGWLECGFTSQYWCGNVGAQLRDTAQAIADAEHRGALAERERVLDLIFKRYAISGLEIAQAIERGDHLTEEQKT